jgi:hypothetical protein
MSAVVAGFSRFELRERFPHQTDNQTISQAGLPPVHLRWKALDMQHRNCRDMAVFMTILVVGVVLILIGVKAGSLSTVCLALSGLYGTWTGNRPRPRDEDEPTPDPPA